MSPVLGLPRGVGLNVLSIDEWFEILPTIAAEGPFQVFKACHVLVAILGTLINLIDFLSEIAVFLTYAAIIDSHN